MTRKLRQRRFVSPEAWQLYSGHLRIRVEREVFWLDDEALGWEPEKTALYQEHQGMGVLMLSGPAHQFSRTYLDGWSAVYDGLPDTPASLLGTAAGGAYATG